MLAGAAVGALPEQSIMEPSDFVASVSEALG
jgi:hypothetical protein